MKIKRRRLIYLSTRYPFSKASGREKMIEQSLRFLSENFDIYFVYFSKDKESIDSMLLQKYNIKQVLELEFPNTIEIAYNVLIRHKYSLQENLFFSKQNEKKICNFIESIEPDLIICDMIRTAQFVENLSIKKILDMDDLLSKRYIRYLNSEGKENKLLGTFEDILPSFVSNHVDKFLKKAILKIESDKIRKRERELTRKFNAVLLVSPKEVNELKSETLQTNIFPNPPAVEIHKNVYNPYIKTNNFLFIGNMKTSQNLSSVKYIVDKILPVLKNKITFKLQIVGIYDERLFKIIEPFKEQITLLDFVNDLEDVIKRNKLLLSPIVFGTGIKTKILEAMSYGLPVVTNSVGAEGLNIKNFQECIIEDNFYKIGSLLIDLVNNYELLSRLSKKSYEYVIKHHSPYLIKKNLISKVNQILEG